MTGASEFSASDVAVVHRDAHYLIVSKPSGLATTSPDGQRCLASLVHDIDPEAPRLHASSRLDAEVSGLVTFARTERATEELLDARRRGTYRRLYVALAQAAPDPVDGVWEDAIALDSRDLRRRRAVPGGTDRHGAKAARTRYACEPGASPLRWLWLSPHTGSTHQLRVHAAAHGAPLVGDVHYGGPRRVVLDDGRVLLARRTMLHCRMLSLPRLDGGGELVVGLQPPVDFADLWSRGGGDGTLLAEEAPARAALQLLSAPPSTTAAG
ncbi:MAG: hypothetical protein KC417_11870 [Myxococcales bacterium]|nr:hypothetical protein [Myxococcales bacterium]